MEITRSDKVRDIALILILAITLLGILIANPGYYNHDELQKLDHIIRYGFDNYVKLYTAISPGSNFGVPVRPFSFFVQGVQALAMSNFPFLVHLFDVLTHATVAILLYQVALQFGASRKLSRSIALVFLINPLTILSTGWSAALMDRWYILFGLLGLLYADRYVRSNGSPILLVIVVFCSALAMLSKETAMILPGLMLLIWIKDSNSVRSKRFWLMSVVWFVPIAAFMLYRLPALINSFTQPQLVEAYSVSISNIPNSLLVYISYPFLFNLLEAWNWVYIPMSLLIIAAISHLLFSAIIIKRFNFKYFILYWMFYLLFLLPVLLLANKGSHYLYGSAMVLSVLVAALLENSNTKFKIYRSVGYVALAVLIYHSILLQTFTYNLGACMNRALISTESNYLSSGKPSAIDFQADPDSPAFVLGRMLTGRQQIGSFYPIQFHISTFGQERQKNALHLTMNKDCILFEDSKTNDK